MAKISEKELEKYSINTLIDICHSCSERFGQLNYLDKKNIIKHILLQEEWSIQEMKKNKKYKEIIYKMDIQLKPRDNIPRNKIDCQFIENSSSENGENYYI